MDFEAELKKVLDDLWRCSMFLMKDSNDASELFQNTIIAALKYFRKKKSLHILNFKKWIISILFNEAKRLFKKKKYISLDEIEEDSIFENTENHKKYADASIGKIYENIKSNLSNIMNNALSYLSPVQREILLAVDILDYDYKEVAEILSVPIGTISSRLDRARKKLKYILSRSLHSYTKYEKSE